VSDEINLLVNGSLVITAAITHESSRELKLDIGSKVFALIKASGVMISREEIRTQKKNQFAATIHTIIRGEKKSEVIMSLADGMQLISTTPNEQLDELGVTKGERALAYFEAANVIIGVAA
jgi:molybdate transport system regulatory protein